MRCPSTSSKRSQHLRVRRPPRCPHLRPPRRRGSLVPRLVWHRLPIPRHRGSTRVGGMHFVARGNHSTSERIRFLVKADLVSIEPVSGDDWEILESRADLAEETILKQVGIFF